MEVIRTKEIARKMAECYGITDEEAMLAVRRVLGTISKELLKGKSVRLDYFGRFEKRIKKECTINSFNGKKCVVPEHSYIFFRPYADIVYYGNMFIK